MPRPSSTNGLAILRALVTTLTVLGFAGLILTTTLAFEEADTTLLVLSTSLLIAPVVVIFVHLVVTRALTREQRHAWFQQLTGRRALWALGQYLSCSDPAAAAAAFAANGRAEPSDR